MRLFVLPGVLHYGGGNGPSGVDWIALIRDWVENNKAPDKIIASKTNKGKVVMTRPLFPYPDEAIYDGKSDSNLFKVTHFLNFIHIFNVGLNDFIPL